MQIHLYQLIIVAVAIIMIYQGFRNYIRGKSGQTFWKFSIRVIIWGGMALIAIFPKFTYILADLIGLEGNINAVILTGFILIFLIIFKLLSAIERIERQITELTRKEALKKFEKKD